MTPSPKKIEPLKPDAKTQIGLGKYGDKINELVLLNKILEEQIKEILNFFTAHLDWHIKYQQQPPKGISVPGNPGVPTKHRESRENSSNLGKPQVRTLNSGRKLYQQGYKDGVEAEHICFHEELDKAREEMVKLIPSLRTGNGSAEENPFQFGQVIGWNEAIGTMIKNLKTK